MFPGGKKFEIGFCLQGKRQKEYIVLMRSPKELSLDSKIIEILESFGLEGKAVQGAKLLLEDEEIQAVQEYANNVSIVRLGYNDHGPVHMRSVMLNAAIMMSLLKKAEIKTSI